MNMPFNAMAEQPLQPSEESAQRSANNWRGGCVALFTRAEATISGAVMTLYDGTFGLARCHAAGSRNEILVELLRRKGDTAAANAVHAYIACYPLRVFLCHGGLSAAVQDSLGFKATFTYFAFSGESVRREVFTIDELKAKAKRNELHAVVQKLEVELRRYAAAGFWHDLTASGTILRAAPTSN